MDSFGLFFSVLFVHMYFNLATTRSKDNIQKLKSPLFVGLNPALQRTITVNNLQLGSVNRASNVKVGIGGKGQNAVVAAEYMQSITKPTLLQFLGQGFEGDAVAQMLKNITDQQLSIRTKGRCRVCVTLLNNEETTEIIEPSEELSLNEINDLLSQTESYYNLEKPMGVAIMGSMPKPCPSNLYASILSYICSTQTKVLLDTVAGINDSINACFLKSSSCVIKLNANELCSLSGVKYNKDSAATPATILDASKIFFKQIQDFLRHIENNEILYFPPILALAITDGPHPAHLITLQGSFENKPNQYIFKVPKLARPLVSPIGAGDATSSGTLMYWCGQINHLNNDRKSVSEIEDSLLKSFQWGLACGSASCMSSSNSVFEIQDVLQILNKIEVNTI